MKHKRTHKNNIMSKYFIVKGPNISDFSDDGASFYTVYNNTLFIEYDTPKTNKNLSSKFSSQDISMLSPTNPNSKTLYFCHFPDDISNRGEFEKLILRFLPNKIYRIKAFIAEKVFSVTFESEEDAIRIATFIPKIDFRNHKTKSQNTNDDTDEEEEEDDDDVVEVSDSDSNSEQHIYVGGSWFEMPIIRFTNIPVDIKPEKIKNLELLKDTVYCQFQKNKTSNKSKVFQNINVIAQSIEQANEIIEYYNFGSFKNEMTYVNWFVDNEVLEQLEKYKIKVFPNENDDLKHMCETDFYKEMAKYGKVFSVTLCRTTKEDNNNENDEDSDYDENEIDDNSEDCNNNDNDDNKEGDNTILFGNVIFVDKNDIQNVGKVYKIEYWFAGGMIYNFPFNTSEEDVKDYLSDFEQKIDSVELRNQSKVDEDNKILPYFFITFDSVDSLEESRQYIENHPYPIKNKNGKMQPFIIPKEKNLPSTIQKYNFHRDLLLKSNTILIENLTSECTSSDLIDLFADYGTIMFFKIDNKKNITANITFNDESEMEAAIEGVNGAIYNKAKLAVSEYVSPTDSLNSSLNNSKKKKKKKNKNAAEATKEDGNTNNSKIKVTKNDNKNISLVINRSKSNTTNQKNDNQVQRFYSSNQRNNNPNQRNTNQNQRNTNQNQRNPKQKNTNFNQRNGNFNSNKKNKDNYDDFDNPKRSSNENKGRRLKNESFERRGRGSGQSRGFCTSRVSYERNIYDDDTQNSDKEFEYDLANENNYNDEFDNHDDY